jgi:steroid delta-isomerase-like uncharacterized protein
MSVENKVSVRRLFEEVWTQGNLDVVDELLAPNYVSHFIPSELPAGPDGFRAYVQLYRTAFPDLQAQMEDIFAEGDKVVARLTFLGTHNGPLMQIPPTGKQASITSMTVVRFENGRAVEAWGEHDTFGLMQKLGVIPTPVPQ